MNWLTNFVKPKLSALVKRKDSAEAVAMLKCELRRGRGRRRDVANEALRRRLSSLWGYGERYRLVPARVVHKPNDGQALGRRTAGEVQRALRATNTESYDLVRHARQLA